MQHLGTRPIQTPRLSLRRFRRSDAGPMFRRWAGVAEATRYLTWSTHQSRRETAGVIRRWLAAYNDQPSFYEWAITLSPGGKLIGSIGAAVQPGGEPACEIGYCIAPEYWNRGFATEACQAVIQYLWGCGFESIDALHDLRNPASGRVMQKCGMTCRGQRMVLMAKNGQRIPCLHYEIRKEGEPD